MNAVDTSPRLVTVVLSVSDLERSAAFYAEAFGLDLHASDHAGDDEWTRGAHAAISWTDGAFVHFALSAARPDRATRNAQVAFGVTDLDDAHRRAVDAGAEVLHPPRPQPWGRSARYRDPDGNVVELTAPT